MRVTVDLSLLSEPEKSEYRQLQKWPAAAKTTAALFLLAWSVPVVVLVVIGVANETNWSDLWMGLHWFVTWCVGIGGVIHSMSSGSETAGRINPDRIKSFLSRINYHGRRHSSPRMGNDFDSRSAGKRNHDWYEGHRELNWRERERGQASGMDVNTYINNVYEHDPD